MNIYLVIDESGSMAALRSDTIGGFNRLLADQKALTASDADAEDAYLHVLCFSTVLMRKPIWGTLIDEVEPWEERGYNPGGGTPLLDAVGDVVSQIEGDDGLIVIITDGAENASKTWTKANVKDLLDKAQERGWKVLFLGANIDAFSEGGSIGVRAGTTSGYTFDATGTQAVYAAASMSSTLGRTGIDYQVSTNASSNPVVEAVDVTKKRIKTKTK